MFLKSVYFKTNRRLRKSIINVESVLKKITNDRARLVDAKIRHHFGENRNEVDQKRDFQINTTEPFVT